MKKSQLLSARVSCTNEHVTPQGEVAAISSMDRQYEASVWMRTQLQY